MGAALSLPAGVGVAEEGWAFLFSWIVTNSVELRAGGAGSCLFHVGAMRAAASVGNLKTTVKPAKSARVLLTRCARVSKRYPWNTFLLV